MRKYHHKVNIITVFTFLITAFFSTSTLFPTNVSATDPSVVDEINLTVPVSCSLSGTGMDTHITELHNTESDSSIGESTITAYCNDLNGFSIYAVGFTNNEYGNNNLVSVTASTTNTIPTGTNTSGDTSSWAMKLTPITNPAPTYPITIIGSTDDTDKTPTTLDYTSFQSVPNEYALVARRKASTDVGTNAEGSSFKTTYQAYAASGQAAGTYEGQVRYTLVHPYNHAVPDPPSFKVLYTGRPLSTEPGHENPVTVLMSDLPASGKYNLLGTADGQYDKLTPDTLYGGYYKFYGDFDDFDKFLETYEVYDGKNMYLNSLTSNNTARATDASMMSPIEGTVYLIKEVPDNDFLYPSYESGLTGGRLVSQWYTADLDDYMYRETGFDIVIVSDNDSINLVGKLARKFTIYLEGPVIEVTASRIHSAATGENSAVAYKKVFNTGEDVGVYFVKENSVVEIVPYWVTPDKYKITSANKLTIDYADLVFNNIVFTRSRTQTTFNRWDG